MDSFAPTHQALVAGNPMALSDHLNNLSPLTDDEILMQLRRRLRHAEASYDSKRPMLLSANNPLVRKLIEDAHENNYHEGTEYVAVIYSKTTG